MGEGSYGDVLVKSFKFSIQPKRWLPYFILSSLFLIPITLATANYMTSMASALPSIADGANAGLAAGIIGGTFSFLAIIFVLAIVSGLVTLLVIGSLFHQSLKENDSIRHSFGVSAGKYLRMILIIIIEIAIVGGIAAGGIGMLVLGFVLPSLGIAAILIGVAAFAVLLIIAVYLGLSFTFSFPAMMASDKGAVASIKESYALFRKHSWQTLAAVVLIAIMSFVVEIIFNIPSYVYSFLLILPNLSSMMAEASSPVATMLQFSPQNLPMTILVGIIANIGVAMAVCLSTKATTEFYLAWRKKKII